MSHSAPMPNLVHPRIVSADEWRAERVALLAREKEVTRQRDQLNAARRKLPMVRVEKSYIFHGPNGRVSLVDLFEGRSQLIVYHFMFDPAADAGCPGCTGFVDALGDLSMLAERQTTFVLISRAPIEKLLAYKARRGWSRPWFSSFGLDFNYDFHVTLDPAIAPVEYNYQSDPGLVASSPVGASTTGAAATNPASAGAPGPRGEAHGLSVFFRIGHEVFHTYSAYARGVESLTDAYSLLDVTPYGRQEEWEDSPPGWPQHPTYGGGEAAAAIPAKGVV